MKNQKTFIQNHTSGSNKTSEYMLLPLPVILKELESSPSSVVPILYTLHYDKQLLETISKPDSKHLVSRTLNLARSNNVYNRWCGINVIKVLSRNYAILSSDGSHFINQLLTILETHNGRTDPKILSSTVDCLNYLCDQIRGKPTLTREILTPKLPSIISLYIEKIDFQPHLLTTSLYQLIKHHPTTFRPFGNKLKGRLLEICNNKGYTTFPSNLKDIIKKTIATLPAIEKTDPEDKWLLDVNNLIKETAQVLFIYKEFLNVNEDDDLLKIFKALPQDADESSNLFPPLKVDVNDYLSILHISTRIEALLDLLNGYLTTETQFGVKIPIGNIVILNEAVCSINTRFVHFKRELRDEALRKLIETSLVINQRNSVKLLSSLPFSFKGNMVLHLTNILSFLETLIPFKNRKINYPDLLVHEEFMCELLSCVEKYLSLLKEYNDNSVLIRFIEVALFLVEPRYINNGQGSDTKKNKQNQQQNGKKHKKGKKNQSAVPLADILSHQHLFKDSVPDATIKAVRQFLSSIITKVNLPPTQYYKIMRYIIIEAVQIQKLNYDSSVPNELKTLLINSVLYPSNEKVSLLPLVSAIIGDDPLLSVFNNPRFPPLPKFIPKVIDEIEDDEEEQDEEEQDQDEGKPAAKRESEDNAETNDVKRPKVDNSISGTGYNANDDTSALEIPRDEVEIKQDTHQDKLFTNTQIDPDQIIQFAQPKAEILKSEPLPEKDTTEKPVIETKVTETQVVTQALEDDDDSDFEMPQLDADDSDDE